MIYDEITEYCNQQKVYQSSEVPNYIKFGVGILEKEIIKGMTNLARAANKHTMKISVLKPK